MSIPNDLMVKCFEDMGKHLIVQLKTKIYDNNTWKATSVEGHRKVISVSHFHRLLFNYIVAKKMQKEELFCRKRETVSYHTSQKRFQEEVFSYDDGFTFEKDTQMET